VEDAISTCCSSTIAHPVRPRDHGSRAALHNVPPLVTPGSIKRRSGICSRSGTRRRYGWARSEVRNPDMRRRSRSLFSIAVSGLVLAAIAAPTRADAGVLAPAASSTSACPGGSPEAAVRGYYGAIIRHQTVTARSCLTPYFLKQSDRVVDPDWQNIATLRSLKLKSGQLQVGSLPGNVPKAYDKPYASRQVDAEFLVHYYRVESSPNGTTIRFIYVVQQHRHSPWRIAAIGSGP